jgi:hypothetical protein
MQEFNREEVVMEGSGCGYEYLIYSLLTKKYVSRVFLLWR